MQDCVFCKIVEGKIPSYKLFESGHALAFLDIMPAVEGHCLVIPKKHFENMLDIPEKELKETIAAAQKTAKAVVKATRAEGFNIHQSNGKAAGQVVMHLHYHIFPRKQGDGFSIPWEHGTLAQEKAKQLQEKIRKLLQ